MGGAGLVSVGVEASVGDTAPESLGCGVRTAGDAPVPSTLHDGAPGASGAANCSADTRGGGPAPTPPLARRFPRGGARNGTASMLLLLFTDEVLLVDLVRSTPESLSLVRAARRLCDPRSDALDELLVEGNVPSSASRVRGNERATGACGPRQEPEPDDCRLIDSSSTRLRRCALDCGISTPLTGASARSAGCALGAGAREAPPAASMLARLRGLHSQRGGTGGHVLCATVGGFALLGRRGRSFLRRERNLRRAERELAARSDTTRIRKRGTNRCIRKRRIFFRLAAEREAVRR